MSSGMAGRASGPTDIKLATANSRISASSCRNSLTHRSTGGASAGRLPTSAHRAAARLSSERSSVPAVKTFRTAGSSGAIRPSDTMAAARSRWPAAPAISINGAIASVAEPPIRPSASIAPERRSGSRRASTSRGTAPRARADLAQHPDHDRAGLGVPIIQGQSQSGGCGYADPDESPRSQRANFRLVVIKGGQQRCDGRAGAGTEFPQVVHSPAAHERLLIAQVIDEDRDGSDTRLEHLEGMGIHWTPLSERLHDPRDRRRTLGHDPDQGLGGSLAYRLISIRRCENQCLPDLRVPRPDSSRISMTFFRMFSSLSRQARQTCDMTPGSLGAIALKAQRAARRTPWTGSRSPLKREGIASFAPWPIFPSAQAVFSLTSLSGSLNETLRLGTLATAPEPKSPRAEATR